MGLAGRNQQQEIVLSVFQYGMEERSAESVAGAPDRFRCAADRSGSSPRLAGDLERPASWRRADADSCEPAAIHGGGLGACRSAGGRSVSRD